MKQVLFGIREVFRTRRQVNFISRPGQIANNQLKLRMMLMKQRLKVTELSHAIEQSVPDKRNSIAFLQF